MGRKRRIWSTVLTCLAVICCESTTDEISVPVKIRCCTEALISKAGEPDENLVTDISILVFDENGILEDRVYFQPLGSRRNSPNTYETSLIDGKKYGVYACVNFGYPVKAASVEELTSLRYHLAYPDEFREGIPMAGRIQEIIISQEDNEITIPLQRLMSKISLRIDRGGLSDDVDMRIVSLRIGNCPKCSHVFMPNKVSSHDECFNVGFIRNEIECMSLNNNISNGLSGTVSLYMFENLQGEFSEHEISDDQDKTFSRNDPRQEVCSYIEIGIDYVSSKLYSADKPLLYRFYLGEDRNSLDIERNCHYRITIIPEDDGLSEDSWRIDKSGLELMSSNTLFEMTPSGYIQGNVGEQLHIRCTCFPPATPFDIGMKELEYDRERGIYDYNIDSDGKGVTLTLKNPGTGIVYMTAGEPVNETGILIVEVNNIKNTIS